MSSRMLLVVIWAFSLTCISCDPSGDSYLPFWLFDRNSDNVLSKAEFDQLLYGFDKDNDNMTTEADYMKMWKKNDTRAVMTWKAYFRLSDFNHNNLIDQSDMDKLFTRFDRNGNGEVSEGEFDLMMEKAMQYVSVTSFLQAGDTNKDNLLTAQEFTAVFFRMNYNSDRQLTSGEFSWISINYPVVVEEIDGLFKHMDLNGDEVIKEAELGHVFVTLDTSGDHYLNLTEILPMSDYFPYTDTIGLFLELDRDTSSLLDIAELDVLFSKFDSNNDSRVTEEELAHEWSDTLKYPRNAMAATFFHYVDIFGNGVFTAKEMVAYFDLSGDHLVSVGEFIGNWVYRPLPGLLNPGIIG